MDILIEGKRWRVVWRDDLHRSEGLYGRANPDTLEIHVDTTVPPDQQRETLLHELMHAIDPKASEAQVDRMSRGLFAAMRTPGNHGWREFVLEGAP